MDDGIPFVLVTGGIVIATILARRVCQRYGVQPLVGFIVTGMLLGLAERTVGFMTAAVVDGLDLLGQLGIIMLLFKVGLESNLAGLLGQLRRALLIWLGNIVIAGAAGFAAAYFLLGFRLVPALFTGVALSATSVGVATAVWQGAGKLDSVEGALLVDVAELDDISAIVLMVLLFAAAPLLIAGNGNGLAGLLAIELAAISGKLLLLAAGCYLFARFAERPFTAWFIDIDLTAATVAATGLACVIAGIASWLGFTVAIGALLAGFAFSRDPAEFEIDRQLTPVYELLSPFFFVMLGFGFEFDGAAQPSVAAAVLLLVAVVGKLVGAGIPAAMMLDRRRGLLIGISMVPRAEIAMIIMLQGLRMGEDFVPAQLFTAMGLVVVSTALAVPAILGPLLASAGRKQV